MTDAAYVPLSHDAAIQALCDCAATVTVLSYQEVVEGYFKLRDLPIPASPSPATSDGVEGLRKALAGFDDDYMTSEKHHPGYVLIPTEKFERIRAALAAIPGGAG